MIEVIQALDIRKRYHTGKEVLRGVSLSVRRGEVFCLVGPNGAGKTTLARILATQLCPTSGVLNILGMDPQTHKNEIRPRLSVVPQGCEPDGDLTPLEHAVYYLRARGSPRAEALKNAEVALRALSLWHYKAEKAATLSGGLRRRILLGMALATGADLMLLDEPTAGLDPISRRETWGALLSELRGLHTIFLTTHSMEEAEILGNRVCMVKNGAVVALGTPSELKAQLPSQKICIRDSRDGASLRAFGKVEKYGGGVILYPSDRAAIESVVQIALSQGCELSVLPTSLEDVFVSLMNDSDK